MISELLKDRKIEYFDNLKLAKMKKIYPVATYLIVFLSANLFAQDVLVVSPGVGTLNQAINTYGGDKIYQLQANQFYQIDGVIENFDFHLQIIGEEPTDGDKPATLQSGQTAEGVPFDHMFDAKGDLTIKNLYLMNVDLTGQIGKSLIRNTQNNSKTVIDNCIIDPVSRSKGLVFNGKGQKLFFINNLCIRMGHQLSPNDGHFFVTNGVDGVGMDTMIIENNTFNSIGTNLWMGGFTANVHNFVWFNHNSIINMKSQIDWSLFENEYYWTNNLMFNVMTQPWSVPWGAMPGHDAGYLLPSLIYADTIPGETLPSTRVQFIQYNNHYRNQGFYDLVNEINNLDDNDTINDIYLQPLIWPIDSTGNREAQLFADDQTFPNWKFGNYMMDVDPGFTDQNIYVQAVNLVEWTKPATYIHTLGFAADGNYPDGTPIPVVSEWAQWHWDPDGDPAINDTWPVFDGTYTNAQLLSGSIEDLPLGDLNWFPDKKAIWEANEQLIKDHIINLNTNKLTFCNPEYKQIIASICEGESASFAGKILTESGVYYDSLKTTQGCDSIIIFELSVNAVYEENKYHSICQGESVSFAGETLSETGIYYDSLTSINGCDSIIIFELSVNPNYEEIRYQAICKGESTVFGDRTLLEPGIYYDSLNTVNGCDSVIILELTVHPVYSETRYQTICMGESYSFNGRTLTEQGIYFDSLESVNGCDSAIILELTVNSSYEEMIQETICRGETMIFSGNTISEAGIYYDSLETQLGCDSIKILDLTVEENPEPFTIVGKTNVDPFDVALYSTPHNNDVSYQWNTEGGNIISWNSNSSVEIQWGEFSTGEVIAFALSPEGCKSDTSILEVSIGNTSNEITNDEQKLRIFPNPAKDFIILQWEGNMTGLPYTCHLSDYTGRILHTSHIKDSVTNISLNQFEYSGILFIQILDENKRLVANQKIVIIN